MRPIRARVLAVMALVPLVALACGSGGGTGPGQLTQPGGATSGSKVSPGKAQYLVSEKERQPIIDVPSNDRDAVVEADTAFGLDLYARAAKSEGDLILSPYSIAVALSMTYAGARGPTADQMARVLHVSLPEEAFHRARNAVDQAVTEPEEVMEDVGGTFEPIRLHLINSLWGQSDYDFHAEFLDLLALHYGAGMRLVDYRSDPGASRAAINRWVEEATEERIVDLIPKELINPMTRLVLVNAVYFKGNWLHRFDPKQTRRGNFILLDGTTKSVPMMRIDRKYKYSEGNGWKAMRLPYWGGASMLVIAPERGRFAEIEARLGPAFLEEIRSSLDDRMVDLWMPRFRFDSRFSLAQTLKGLGMVDAFEPPPGPSTADLTGITPARELFLRDVVHKGFVSVDERGTEAAAATGAVSEAVSGASPATLHLDRPFMFLIQDDETGTILFMGRLMDPGGGS